MRKPLDGRAIGDFNEHILAPLHRAPPSGHLGLRTDTRRGLPFSTCESASRVRSPSRGRSPHIVESRVCHIPLRAPHDSVQALASSFESLWFRPCSVASLVLRRLTYRMSLCTPLGGTGARAGIIDSLLCARSGSFEVWLLRRFWLVAVALWRSCGVPASRNTCHAW